jgi:hypothetical protein
MTQHTERRTPGGQSTPGREQRGADRNQSLVDDEIADPKQLVPSLDPGVTLLDVEDERGVLPLQAVVLDHLLTADGPAFWVDSQGFATTTTFSNLAPSRRLLNRIRVARGFTAYQHYAAINDLVEVLNDTVQATAGPGQLTERRTELAPVESQTRNPHTPALIVVPAVDAHYRGADRLAEAQAQRLQARVLARLSSIADAFEVPVLLTRTTDDAFSAPVQRAATEQIACRQTKYGPQFEGDEFETLLYPVDGGDYYQTTLSYWREVLAARARSAGLEPENVADSQRAPTTDAKTASAGGGQASQAQAVHDPVGGVWHAGGPGGW